MATTAYKVTGMTCEHCANAVSEEIGDLEGVSAVKVDLVAGGISTVTVTSANELTPEEVSGALDEAGNYQIA